jgi:hypothetical protein
MFSIESNDSIDSFSLNFQLQLLFIYWLWVGDLELCSTFWINRFPKRNTSADHHVGRKTASLVEFVQAFVLKFIGAAF